MHFFSVYYEPTVSTCLVHYLLMIRRRYIYNWYILCAYYVGWLLPGLEWNTLRQGGHEALLEWTFLGRNRRRIRKTHTCPPHTQHNRRWNWTSDCAVRTRPPTWCLWHGTESKKGKVHPITVMKVEGGAEVHSTLSLTSMMGMGGQRHDPAALPPEKETRYPM
jgi:hypothetical protein